MTGEIAKKDFFGKIKSAVGSLASKGRGTKSAFMTMAAADVNGTIKTTFNDVAGNYEAKEAVSDIVDFIKNPAKYERYGAKIPRGVMLYGPPGTGKTMLAKAVAGEAGVPFYAVNGSDFVQLYVGVGASRVRDLFKKARQSGKAVVFIDEIDALGKKRSQNGGQGGGSDEREQTLNALLTEMQGFSSGEGVVVIAATNRADTLDEALLRAGRFDRQVEVGLPDVAARREILSLYASGKPLDDAVSLDELAKKTAYFSGATLENMMNEAAINAAKADRGDAAITKDDVEKAFVTAMIGAERKRKTATEADKSLAAFHEAGHALAARKLLTSGTVAKVTIVQSATGAGGFCLNIPPDRPYCTKKELEAQAIVALSGRAAEELTFGEDDVTTGAANDLEKCVKIADDYISKYGFCKLGLAQSDCKQERAALIDGFYDAAKRLLTENADALNRLAAALVERETLDGSDVDALIFG